MATPTEDLVLRVLRDIQGTLAEHGRQLSRLENGQDEIRESIVTALGLSAHANVRNDKMEDRLVQLEARNATIDDLIARLERLESEKA